MKAYVLIPWTDGWTEEMFIFRLGQYFNAIVYLFLKVLIKNYYPDITI